MSARARRAVRVALVAASPRTIGGHSVQAQALASALARDGVEVDWIAIDRPLAPPWSAIRRVRGVRTCVNEILYAMALSKLAAADVAHVFSASYWSFLLAPVPAICVGRALGRRVVLHYHSGEAADHLATWGWRVHPWLRLADEIVVCSEFQRAVFERHGHRCRVIPNVVDLARFAYREREPLRPRFVCTRNFERHYGIDVVLDAFARIRAVHPDATLTLAGTGSEDARLRARAAALGDAVRFAGAVDPTDMARWLDDADVYLNASTIDNQPVSLLEAMAAGLVVISTDVGGIGEMLTHDASGVLVPPGDAAGMAAAACRLLADPARAAALATAARARLDRFTWAAVRDEWRAAYGLDRAVGAGSMISTSGARA